MLRFPDPTLARLWLSQHEVNLLLRKLGPQETPEWVTARTMVSYVAAWSVGHDLTGAY